jgi:hypothetical protein
MTMILKSYTISSDLKVSKHRNGELTEQTIYSEAGVRAELMLESNAEWAVPGAPRRMHVSVVVEIDQPPNLSGSEFETWLRDHIVEMLSDRETG